MKNFRGRIKFENVALKVDGSVAFGIKLLYCLQWLWLCWSETYFFIILGASALSPASTSLPCKQQSAESDMKSPPLTTEAIMMCC
jgi:hypothetical protein